MAAWASRLRSSADSASTLVSLYPTFHPIVLSRQPRARPARRRSQGIHEAGKLIGKEREAADRVAKFDRRINDLAIDPHVRLHAWETLPGVGTEPGGEDLGEGRADAALQIAGGRAQGLELLGLGGMQVQIARWRLDELLQPAEIGQGHGAERGELNVTSPQSLVALNPMNPEKGFGVQKRVDDGAGLRRLHEQHGAGRDDFLRELLPAGEPVGHDGRRIPAAPVLPGQARGSRAASQPGISRPGLGEARRPGTQQAAA